MVKSEKPYFRSDINGLRAIAVLGVILFHLQIHAFAGGFLGVDVFFTISGYLITGSILREVEVGGFSFRSFYYRRTRRLAPALIVTVAGSLVMAIVLLTPSYLIQTSKAALAAFFSVSNIYFWLDSGYFSADAFTKPLLHTWSLGLEEQFYLVWPLFIVLATRFRALLASILVLFVVGLCASEAAAIYEPNAAFYLLPFRAFEFAIGAMVVFTEKAWRQPKIVNESLKILSLVVLVASFTIFDSTTTFPGLYALIPCVATALLIHVGPTRIAGLLLDNPVSSVLGRISYSLYLVHWPIVVFYKYISSADLTNFEKTALFFLMIAAGCLLYVLVEQRFRFYDFVARRRSLYASVAGMAALCLLAAGAWAGQGWTWRSPGYLPAGYVDQQKERRYTEIGRLCEARSWETCWDIVPTKAKRVLILGDSEATDGLNMVTPALAREYLILSDQPGCPPFTETSTVLKGAIPDRANCIATNRKRVNATYLKNFDVIVVSALWQWYTPEHLNEFLDFVQSNAPHAKVIVFGSYYMLKQPCWEYMEKNRTADCFKQDNIDHKFLFENELKKVVDDHKYLYISKKDTLCTSDGTCALFAGDKKKIPLTWDVFHLSYEFALMVGAKVEDQIRQYVYDR